MLDENTDTTNIKEVMAAFPKEMTSAVGVFVQDIEAIPETVEKEAFKDIPTIVLMLLNELRVTNETLADLKEDHDQLKKSYLLLLGDEE